MATDSPDTSYVCDTLPAPRLASVQSVRSPSPPSSFQLTDDLDARTMAEDESLPESSDVQNAPAQRKLCVRHQRMADEGTNLKLQQVSLSFLWFPGCSSPTDRVSARASGSTSFFPRYFFRSLSSYQSLDALPVQEREAVNAIWSNFSSSSHPRRALILQGLLTMCCFSQLSLLTEHLAQLIRIDCFTVFPREISLKVLGYLDAMSLCRAAQVSKHWKRLADDDILWRGICEQHIGQKCSKCGWGLPILEHRRTVRVQSSSPCPSPSLHSPQPLNKRELVDEFSQSERPRKRQRSETSQSTRMGALRLPLESSDSPSPQPSSSNADRSLLVPSSPSPPVDSVTRPWKDVYSERLTIERNWRRGRCTVQTLKGHTDGVMCLQFSETLSHPSFPILITGSYDRTARVWNLETGMEVACLKGHTRAVRALQFDEAKLITGSMDHTIRVWNWRTGKCIRTLEGHTEGIVCLNYDSNVLASGSVDATVKVWNFRTGAAFTLRGHSDWVNSVQLWDSESNTTLPVASSSTSMFDALPSESASPPSSSAPQIDPGKMLFSASDDGTMRLWDLTCRTCVRQFTGHVGQVQSMKLLLVDESCGESSRDSDSEVTKASRATLPPPDHPGYNPSSLTLPTGFISQAYGSSTFPSSDGSFTVPMNKGKGKSVDGQATSSSSSKRRTPVLISGSLDNTIKLWDIDTGQAVKTLFGHIEGVWAVASDKLRLVSGSHDRTIKVCSVDSDASCS
jgi:F-box/WD-40 domain protein MET30